MSGGGVGGTIRSVPRDPARRRRRRRRRCRSPRAGSRRGGRRGRACRRPASRAPSRRRASGVTLASGHRHDLAPEALHLVAVEALGAGQQLRGVDQVRGAALVDVDLEVGPAPHQGPGRGGVVEVDVGEQRAPAAARRRAPRAGSRSEDSGPGSTRAPSTSQQPITCGRPRCMTSMTRIGGRRLAAQAARQRASARPRPRASAAGPPRGPAARSRARGSPSRSWPRR